MMLFLCSDTAFQETISTKFFSPHVGHIYDAEQETKLQSVDWLNWAPESELAPVC